MVYRSLSQFTHATPAIPNLYVMLDADKEIKALEMQTAKLARDVTVFGYSLHAHGLWSGPARQEFVG
jgi:hypothetical protein